MARPKKIIKMEISAIITDIIPTGCEDCIFVEGNFMGASCRPTMKQITVDWTACRMPDCPLITYLDYQDETYNWD